MQINLNTLFDMPIAIDSYSDKVSALLNLDGHLRDHPFAFIQKKMLGSEGEIFTPDRFIKFRANGSFSKLKKQEVIRYSDIIELETYNGSTGLEWIFSGTTGKFSIGLVFYGKVKGINPRDIFWYEIDKFPERSGAFYALLSEVLPCTGLTFDLKPSSVKRKLEKALDFFEGSRALEEIDLELTPDNAHYPGFTVMQYAFAGFLAGSAIATETTRDLYLEIFRDLDGIFARMLKKLMPEYNASMGSMFTHAQKIYDADEKFQRLSSIWYLRQIVNLHFASKYLPEDETDVWPMKVLKPRAREYTTNNRKTVSIKLPPLEIFEEAIAKLEK